jgi:hypothetical protein
VQGGRLGKHSGNQVGTAFDQVLAIVQHDQESSPTEVLPKCVQRLTPATFLHVKHTGNRVGNTRGITHRCQIHEPDTVRETRATRRGRTKRHSRLANTTRASQRHKPMSRECLFELAYLVLSPNEAAHFSRQIADTLPRHYARRRAGVQPDQCVAYPLGVPDGLFTALPSRERVRCHA